MVKKYYLTVGRVYLDTAVGRKKRIEEFEGVRSGKL